VTSTNKPLRGPIADIGQNAPKRRTRALDVGAGVGRVTADVLLHIFDDVVLLEPVEQFIQEAYARGKASESSPVRTVGDAQSWNETHEAEGYGARWKGIKAKSKSVTFVQATLQSFDPSHAVASKILGRVGRQTSAITSTSPDRTGSGPSAASYGDMNSGYDVIWCQWCLGHLSDSELVTFFGRATKALRTRDRGSGENPSCIIVKENLCRDFGEDGVEGGNGIRAPRTVFDEEDSSLTRCETAIFNSSLVRVYEVFGRSDLAWKAAFAVSKLILVHEQVQHGFPEGLYDVKL
jgi:protein N-terminal methyltransferase